MARAGLPRRATARQSSDAPLISLTTGIVGRAGAFE